MLIKNLVPNANFDLEIKILKKIDEGEKDKNGKKLKFIKVEVEDKEGTKAEVTLWDLENYNRIISNIGKNVLLKKMWVSSYEDNIIISSGKYGYVKEIY